MYDGRVFLEHFELPLCFDTFFPILLTHFCLIPISSSDGCQCNANYFPPLPPSCSVAIAIVPYSFIRSKKQNGRLTRSQALNPILPAVFPPNIFPPPSSIYPYNSQPTPQGNPPARPQLPPINYLTHRAQPAIPAMRQRPLPRHLIHDPHNLPRKLEKPRTVDTAAELDRSLRNVAAA